VFVLALLTPLRPNLEKLLGILSVPKALDLLAAVIATPEREAKNDLPIDRVPQEFQGRQFYGCRFLIKRAGLIPAMGAGIRGDIATALLIGTNGLEFAWTAVPPFGGVAEDGHRIVIHIL
jgi:hypothetical protein